MSTEPEVLVSLPVHRRGHEQRLNGHWPSTRMNSTGPGNLGALLLVSQREWPVVRLKLMGTVWRSQAEVALVIRLLFSSCATPQHADRFVWALSVSMLRAPLLRLSSHGCRCRRRAVAPLGQFLLSSAAVDSLQPALWLAMHNNLPAPNVHLLRQRRLLVAQKR